MGNGANVHNVINIETILFGLVVFGIIISMFRALVKEGSPRSNPNIKRERVRVHRKGRAKLLFCEETDLYVVLHLTTDEADLESLLGYRVAVTEEVFEAIDIGGLYDATFNRSRCGWRITEVKEPAKEKTSGIVFEA